MSNYSFQGETCIIEDFDKTAPFSSFLPGLAGLTGCPMWTYYVNRGQAIVSFGVHNKAHAMMEFNPANLGYRRVSQDGFRTFIKQKDKITEYFAPTACDSKRKMTINMNSLLLEESNEQQHIKMSVKYFTLPNESFPALVRKVCIRNEGTEDTELEVLDGIGQLIPYGIENSGFKEMSNLNKSWAEVTWNGDLPLFHTRSIPGDEAEVEESTSAYFAFTSDGLGTLIRPITDTRVLFNEDETQTFPWNFEKKSLAALKEIPQYDVNRYPCVFSPIQRKLAPKEQMEITTYFGFASAPNSILDHYKRLLQADYIQKAEEIADSLTAQLTNAVATKTASEALNGYFRQSYLDNLLRGGYPVIMGEHRKKVIHLFARKHGDPERDYNFFSLSAEPYSQGNGNYRDVNQNRRNDVYFVPESGEFTVCSFMSLIGADGYNPLEVKGLRFEFTQKEESCTLLGVSDFPLLSKRFTVGELYLYLKKIGKEPETYLHKLLDLTEEHLEANFAEGYWSDHFTYNLDLIESYASIFPDRMKELLFDKSKVRYFRSPVEVLPRTQRYGFVKGKLRQRFSIRRTPALDYDWLRDAEGKDATTSVFGKLLLLTAIKFASLDPLCCGIEMDGGKPGWNDAMNGVPFLLGSGTSESFETKRIIHFLLEQKGYQSLQLPTELYDLLVKLHTLCEIEDDFEFWDKRSLEREIYRARLYKDGVLSGAFKQIEEKRVNTILKSFLSRMDKGTEKALELGGGIAPTFLVFEATECNDNLPKAVSCRALPLFLEGPVRMMKTVDRETAREIHQKVTASACFDEKLKMYKTSVPLEEEGYEIGRIRAFTPGWLERESIFLHMSYKYIYGLMRAGLYDEFYEAIKTGFVPFMKPEVYGRSTLENCSFIASSKNPDPTVHGRGYVSRLSGSTAEVLSIWLEMFMGKKFFRMDGAELCLTFAPKLSGELFTEDGSILFTLLGSIPVAYRNTERKNTYGEGAAVPVKITVTSQEGVHQFVGDTIKGELAEKIRNRAGIQRIEVTLE